MTTPAYGFGCRVVFVKNLNASELWLLVFLCSPYRYLLYENQARQQSPFGLHASKPQNAYILYVPISQKLD